MKEISKIAIEGGYLKEWLEGDEEKIRRYLIGWDIQGNEGNMMMCVLDPLFWQSLGRSLGWRDEEFDIYDSGKPFQEWKEQWHSFIDHLADGKDAESFFEELLK